MALNFHEAESSPTINGGENSDSSFPFVLPVRDLAGHPRIDGGVVDIGAYER